MGDGKMTRDDIIRLARKAGHESTRWNSIEQFEEFLERFAHTVYTHLIITTLHDAVGQAIAREREACAKVCEQVMAAWTEHDYNSACGDCAAAIRNRSKQ